MPHTLDIHHNAAQHRFEATVEGQLSEVNYRVQGEVMQITHTAVPQALEGQGIASALVGAALNHAHAQGLKVDPQCSYAKAYMQRHPETQGLLA